MAKRGTIKKLPPSVNNVNIANQTHRRRPAHPLSPLETEQNERASCFMSWGLMHEEIRRCSWLRGGLGGGELGGGVYGFWVWRGGGEGGWE